MQDLYDVLLLRRQRDGGQNGEDDYEFDDYDDFDNSTASGGVCGADASAAGCFALILFGSIGVCLLILGIFALTNYVRADRIQKRHFRRQTRTSQSSPTSQVQVNEDQIFEDVIVSTEERRRSRPEVVNVDM